MDYFEALGARRPQQAAPAEKPDTTDNNGSKAEAASAPNGEESLQQESSVIDNADNSEAEGEREQDNTDPAADKKPEQTKEERAKNAARRREDETKAKVDAALAEERRKFESEKVKLMDDAIAGLNFINPYTNKQIKTQAEYAEFVKKRDEESINEGLARAGIQREVLDAAINQHPDVIKARELVTTAEQEKTRAFDMRAEERAKAELTEIQKYDPSVKSIEDLFAMDNYARIRALVNGGASISEAYKTVNFDAIRERERKAAAQETFNSIQSKSHLTGEVPHGQGGITVPAGIKNTYRAMYGNISDAEIQKKYEKLVKKG